MSDRRVGATSVGVDGAEPQGVTQIIHGVTNLGRFPPWEAASRQPARALVTEHGGRRQTHARTTGSSVPPGVARRSSISGHTIVAGTWTPMIFGYDKVKKEKRT